MQLIDLTCDTIGNSLVSAVVACSSTVRGVYLPVLVVEQLAGGFGVPVRMASQCWIQGDDGTIAEVELAT